MNLKFQTTDAPGRAVSPLTAAVGSGTSAGAHGLSRRNPMKVEVTRPTIAIRHSPFAIRNSKAFTLIEVMVVMALMGLIVLALMTVFNGTQTAFRAQITQSDVLESGRAVTDLIKSDLETMTPSVGTSNGAVNFYVFVPATKMVQSLPGSGNQRTNVLENVFILTRQNRTWTGIGYMVDTNSQPTNSLYRFSMSMNVISGNPALLFNSFYSNVVYNTFINWSHLMDGVVDLRVRANDPGGFWMTNTVDSYGGQSITNQNTFFLSPVLGEVGFYMYSNTVPASVEVELGVLEDRTLQRAESLPVTAQANYLAQHAGQVHIFRQRVWIRNVDPSAYQ